MTQSDLLSWTPPETFSGDTFNQKLDGKRLGKQLARVRALMLDGVWRSLREISDAVGSPEASVSARLRDLRGMGMKVESRRRSPKGGLWEYSVREP